ncbi:Flp pilus assembly protein CpaB [Altererythrobacter arenosus]|uniref:Flp pilus assembly protein CpaB n=1 Tax=Altererythrobacter arenosus TaxID=3032592 RepID=A0ABY8FSS1_9SPHN|nr:Flp pilus assembly protein CpaB [Altererythrobacter sp. CAU 1644]WFL78045.1 Flp pilus assembly protein CpaB [Altererythrobacter sp. CAU 1644]
MDKKKLVLLLGALVIAIGTALAARSMFAGAGAPEAEAAPVPKGPKVLVAQRALPIGTIITPDALNFQQWPEELVQDAYFIDGESDVSQLVGTVVRHQITAGEPVTQGSLVKPGDRGFLAAALGPGMRAVTVPVSVKTGVAGFVFPGDRVDLVLTQTIKGGGEGTPLKAAETIFRNLRVLATDQRVEGKTNKKGQSVAKTSRTVTLEVTPKLAERVLVAQTLGQISLVLRSIADNQAELEKAIATGDVVIPSDATPEEEEALLRAAMNRPIETTTTFSTGGDVSRFERSTVPPRAPTRADFNPGDMFRPTGPARTGPVINVTRGNSTKSVPIGANGQVVKGKESQPSMFEQMIGAAMQAQSQGMSNTGSTIGSITGTEGQ